MILLYYFMRYIYVSFSNHHLFIIHYNRKHPKSSIDFIWKIRYATAIELYTTVLNNLSGALTVTIATSKVNPVQYKLLPHAIKFEAISNRNIKISFIHTELISSLTTHWKKNYLERKNQGTNLACPVDVREDLCEHR